jgi:hypothetical protein
VKKQEIEAIKRYVEAMCNAVPYLRPTPDNSPQIVKEAEQYLDSLAEDK